MEILLQGLNLKKMHASIPVELNSSGSHFMIYIFRYYWLDMASIGEQLKPEAKPLCDCCSLCDLCWSDRPIFRATHRTWTWTKKKTKTSCWMVYRCWCGFACDKWYWMRNCFERLSRSCVVAFYFSAGPVNFWNVVVAATHRLECRRQHKCISFECPHWMNVTLYCYGFIPNDEPKLTTF